MIFNKKILTALVLTAVGSRRRSSSKSTRGQNIKT